MRLKVNICIFCLRIIIKPYHFVMLLEAEDTGLLQVEFCLFLSWPLLSQDINLTGKSKLLLCCLLATITITICNLEHCFPSADNYFTVALC